MLDLNIRFQIAAILLWLLIVVDYKRNPHLQLLSTKCFRILLIVVGVNLTLDVASVYTITHMDTISFGLNRLVHQLFIGSVILVQFFNYMYIEILDNEQKRQGLIRRVISVIPLGISAFMLLFGRLDYHVDERAVYSYGPMAYSIFACGSLYLVMCLIKTVCKKSSLSPSQKGSVWISLIVWLGILGTQMVFPRLLLSGLGTVLLLLCVYFPFENQKVNYDVMSDCFNRTAFHRMVNEYAEKGKYPYLISITCDNFDQINSILGHNTGSEGLRKIKKILRKAYKTQIYHSRTNTLSIFQYARPNEEELSTINCSVSEIDFSGYRLKTYITVIDLERYVEKRDDVFEFLGCVLDEMKDSESRISYLTVQMVEKKKRQDQIELQLTQALDEEGFEMYYQPIYCTKDKSFHSVEALLRIKKIGELGYVSPEEFIPIAEKKGLILRIGEKVIEMTARDIRDYHMSDMGVVFVEINLSRVQTVTPEISAYLKETLSRFGVQPDFINVEITETAAVASEDVLMANIAELKKDGFALSMDDFGTGYSNLAQINRIHYDLIKLDKSMIWPAFDKELDEKERHSAKTLLASTIHMMKAMHVKIVAEGVETGEMSDFLAEHGVDYQQGYYFARPMPMSKLKEFYKSVNQSEI